MVLTSIHLLFYDRLGGKRQLYNRPCYDELTNESSSLTQFLIHGTPGIGKSMYLQIFLVHLSRLAKERGQDTPSIHYMKRSYGKVIIWSFLPDGSVINITNDIYGHAQPQYLLSDDVDIPDPTGTILYMVVTESNYKYFYKRMQESRGRAESIVMPVFTYEEILRIKPADMDDCIAEFRYDIFGGSARDFGSGHSRTNYILPVVTETLTLLFPDIKELHHDSWMSACRQVSMPFIRISNDGYETRANVFKMLHMQPDSSNVWASEVMEWLSAAIIDEYELERIIGKSGVEEMFRVIRHRKLLTSTVPYLLKPLSASMSPTMPTFCKMNFNLPVARLKTVDDIQGLPIATYGLPIINNFSMADAIIQPDTILQFTNSPEKYDGEVEHLSKIRAQLKAPMRDHRIIFIIPAQNIETFRYHPQLNDIHQLVCFDDPSVMRKSLMNNEEKMAWKTVKIKKP